MADKKYDLVLFGATGFTGNLTADYLARARTPNPLRWALAGRNPAKLAEVQARLAAVGAQVDVVQADAADEGSLRRLARATQVVITTVGPYVRHGEPLVRACVEEGADYVDLTGEPRFVDELLLRYQTRAEQQGVRIVNCCGFDSIPHDLGVFHALQVLRQKLGSLRDHEVEVEGFVRARGTISGGTWHSALGIMGELGTRKERERPRPQLPLNGVGRKVRGMPVRARYERRLGLWALPMPTIDPLVVCRSARLDPEYGRAFRYGHYVGLPNLPVVGGALLGVGTLVGLAHFEPTRELLLKLLDPGEGPSAEARAKGWFSVTMLARAGGREARTQVRGGDPGYGDTAKMLAESALCLAFDRERLPRHFGVVPPAAALGQALLDRLSTVGIHFSELAD